VGKSAQASILIIDDDTGFAGMLGEIFGQEGFRAVTAGTLKDGMMRLAGEDFDLVLLDVRLPDGNGLDALPRIKSVRSFPEVIIMTGFGDVGGARLALRNGAWDYLEKTSGTDSILLPVIRALQYREARTPSPRAVLFTRSGIRGKGQRIAACLDFVARVAPTDAAVLIRGETGTGKELFARAIHENSRRSRGKFVVVDCAALSPGLAGSILFGHDRGAFTGADRVHQGLVKEAHGGTLFLDEVAELPLEMQTVFLRVLQEHRFRSLGGRNDETSDFRLVAATNRNLEGMEREGRFRSELLFRLGALVLTAPPLRECREDIAELSMLHLASLSARYSVPCKGLAPDFLESLLLYNWPGNVRQLFHVLERAFAEALDETVLFSRDLPLEIRLKARETSQRPPDPGTSESSPVSEKAPGNEPFLRFRDARNEAIAQAEREYIGRLLEVTGGDVKRAVALSGLSRSQLYRLIKKYAPGRRSGGA